MDEIELNATELKVGCCIIMNDVEQPCAKLIAVVTEIDVDSVVAKYLSGAKELKPYRKGCLNQIENVTPVGRFGVSVKYGDGQYWCEVVGESTATYRDGKPRQWQDRQGVVKRQVERSVIDVLLQR